MKTKFFIICLICVALLSGCASSADKTSSETDGFEQEEAGSKTGSEKGKKSKSEQSSKKEKKDVKDNRHSKRSLSQRMAGKYSYEYVDEYGNEELYMIDVVPFGNNLYAYCGQAMTDDYEDLSAYTFWASEFIPYDAGELISAEGDKITVNELRFSIMSNAGLYWDAGIKCTITLTEDGLLFEGTESDGFLTSENGEGRLFVKDDRVEDAFKYLKRDSSGQDEDLQGFWVLEKPDSNLYLEFAGTDLYMYSKDPETEAFYAAGGCDFTDGHIECRANCIDNGGMPFELSFEYEVSDEKLKLEETGYDRPDRIPQSGVYRRIDPDDVHVTVMDEVVLDSASFGMYGSNSNYEELTLQDYYGVFVSSSKDPDKCTSVIEKLETSGIEGSFVVYTPDFSKLNQEPYYVVTTGLYISEDEASDSLTKVKNAGFGDAYMKSAGSYTGDKYQYTMYDADNIEVLNDGVLLSNVPVSIPYPTDGEAVTSNLLVTKEAVFDESAETEYFGNYEDGDTPYEWLVRNYNLFKEDVDQYLVYGPALSGIFEVSIKDGKIIAYYGSYWWD